MICACRKAFHETPHKYRDPAVADAAFAKTIIFGDSSVLWGAERPDEREILELWRLFDRHWLRDGADILISTPSGQSFLIPNRGFVESLSSEARKAWDYVRYLFHSFLKCQISLLKDESIALAPKGSTPGDRVVIFHGATSPFVIRSIEGPHNPKYLLIGTCYVHDIMNGQYVEQLGGTGIQSQSEWVMLI